MEYASDGGILGHRFLVKPETTRSGVVQPEHGRGYPNHYDPSQGNVTRCAKNVNSGLQANPSFVEYISPPEFQTVSYQTAFSISRFLLSRVFANTSSEASFSHLFHLSSQR
jgi:hypothetical protein